MTDLRRLRRLPARWTRKARALAIVRWNRRAQEQGSGLVPVHPSEIPALLDGLNRWQIKEEKDQ
jgi:hypothetical protein